MGIKNFYNVFKSEFSECHSLEYNTDAKILIIEMNGFFYNSCKRLHHGHGIFRLRDKHEIHLKIFQDVTEQLYHLIKIYNSVNTFFLVIDGISTMMKNMEQRQRRYKNSLENKYEPFDLNNFTPGTKLMHHLTKYIDWYIRQKMTNDPIFRQKVVYFSNEKVPNEGEYKIISFIQKVCSPTDPILIYSSDSDVILLSMLLHNYEDITLIRDYEHTCKEYISIGTFRNILLRKYASPSIISHKIFFFDIFLILLLLGNDYLPNSPCIYNFSVVISDILPHYKQFGRHFFHDNLQLHVLNFCDFIQSIKSLEKKWICEKYSKDTMTFFPDGIFLNHATSQKEFIFEDYKTTYKSVNYMHNKVMIQNYFCTIQNIFDLILARPNAKWSYFYQFYKSPFLSDIVFSDSLTQCVQQFHQQHEIISSVTFDPYLHLCLILPPPSKNLLPPPFQTINIDLKNYYPSFLEIDLTGKSKLWESVIKLPPLDYTIFHNYYKMKKKELNMIDQKRNRVGKIFQYNLDEKSKYTFESYYGDILDCQVNTKFLDH